MACQGSWVPGLYLPYGMLLEQVGRPSTLQKRPEEARGQAHAYLLVWRQQLGGARGPQDALAQSPGLLVPDRQKHGG